MSAYPNDTRKTFNYNPHTNKMYDNKGFVVIEKMWDDYEKTTEKLSVEEAKQFINSTENFGQYERLNVSWKKFCEDYLKNI